LLLLAESIQKQVSLWYTSCHCNHNL